MAEVDSCLVLCIEARDDDDYDTIETRLFVTYDFLDETYVLYGKHIDNINEGKRVFLTRYQPFFFRFNKSKDVYQMILTIISSASNCSVTLYNYDNMPYDCETVNYHDLNENKNNNYVLVAYDNSFINKKTCIPTIKMLKRSFNYF